MVLFGDPHVLEFDESSNVLGVHIAKPDREITVLEKLRTHLQDVKHAHIALSGGVDSQFWVRVCDHFNIPMRATTYLTYWEGSPINTDDFVCAQLTAQRYNIDWEVVEINLHDFLGTPKLLEIAKRYGTTSQQLALHAYYLEQVIRPGETVFLGGECVYMGKTRESSNLIAGYRGRLPDWLVFKKLFDMHNVEYMKDVFLLDPELHYLMLKQSINVTREHNVYLDISDKQPGLQTDNLMFKRLLWDSIVPGSINTLIKSTGFEKLKKYMAMTTGTYNQFDVKYRQFLEQVARNYVVDCTTITEKLHSSYVFAELAKEFDDVLAAGNAKPIVTYMFDF